VTSRKVNRAVRPKALAKSLDKGEARPLIRSSYESDFIHHKSDSWFRDALAAQGKHLRLVRRMSLLCSCPSDKGEGQRFAESLQIDLFKHPVPRFSGTLSLQLTVLVTSSIEEGEGLLSFFKLFLTTDTKANSRESLTTGIRNNHPAFLAMS
jgi:hypothetical protein